MTGHTDGPNSTTTIRHNSDDTQRDDHDRRRQLFEVVPPYSVMALSTRHGTRSSTRRWDATESGSAQQRCDDDDEFDWPYMTTVQPVADWWETSTAASCACCVGEDNVPRCLLSQTTQAPHDDESMDPKPSIYCGFITPVRQWQWHAP